jgi:L-lactate utilization protein LutB
MAEIDLRVPDIFYNAERVRKHSWSMIQDLLPQTIEALKIKSCQVCLASNAQKAQEYIFSIVGKNTVLKSKSSALEEIELKQALIAHGNTVIESEFDEFAGDLLKMKSKKAGLGFLWPKLTTNDFQFILKELGINKIENMSTDEISKLIKQYVRKYVSEAPIGITGAGAIVAETGTIVFQENECNSRLVSNMPPIHIVVAGIDKIVPTLEDAITVLKADARQFGQSIGNYISFVSGPSRTGDIEFFMCNGMHGPMEVHVVLLNNNRLS